MEIDVREEEPNNNNSNSTNGGSKLIDTINNNIDGFFDSVKFSESATKIDADESSLPSPKAMLEAIMPCEKLCNSFRQIADDIGGGDVIKTHIKHEISEPKLSSDGEEYGRDQFPLNLKSMRHGNEFKQALNMDKLESIREEDYGQCDSPKAKKVFINMLDSHMHSPLHSKQPKMKSIDGKSINLSSPCSYTSSSPSSTSSLSSISNVQHQKQAMANPALNGSMHDILNMPNFNHLQQMQPIGAGLQNLTHRSTPMSLSGGGGGSGSPLMSTGLPIGLGLAQSPQMPQLVLASGQLGQGIQGAQVLIPTPQGITSQTILTIPVSQQLPTNLTIDQLLQALSTAAQKQQSAETASNTNHVLSNVPNLSPNPILLNSHLLANGAQQLLSIQPQLLALQQQQQHQHQQQQSPESHPFYRKLHHGQMEPPEMNSPPLHSRKDQMSINTFKMRNREMSKRLARIARPLNGHGEINQHHHHHQMENESHSPEPSSSGPRVPTTNGETSHSSSKPLNTEQSRASPLSPKPYQPTPSPSKSNLEYRAMRELLAEGEKRSENHYSMEQNQNQNQTHNGSQLKINQSLQEKLVEKAERESPQPPDNQQSIARSQSSPMQFSNDSNSGDGNFDELQNEGASSQREGSIPEGIDLDEINEFAQAFKLQRLSLGLTQTQVGQALSVTEGPAYSQSAICSALAARMYAAVQLSSQQQQMFEKLDITPKSAQKIKPVLEQWMKEAKGSRFKMGESPLSDFMGVETSKKRKRRTSFTPHALEILNSSFERNTHPSGTDITALAQALGYEREVIRIWFCNKRQALKNTVRMMSKGMPN